MKCRLDLHFIQEPLQQMKYTTEIYADEVTDFPKGTPAVPKNRFTYLDDELSIDGDIDIFEEWADGFISTKNATKKFRNKNLFDTISEADFIQNANWLGYFRIENCPQVQMERGEF